MPLGSHVFQAKVTIVELILDIIGTNLLSKFHEDQKIYIYINVASRVLTRKNAPPPGGHVFQPTSIIVLTRKNALPPWWPYIIGMNLLTKFHEDQTINVASGVKNAPPPRQPCFSRNGYHFKTHPRYIETNLLTKFHEDWTINVASRELTSQMLTSHNARGTTDKR
ncbi:hypothetical protein DPMN_030531 [Dreissena polymorpha]|uniref:Uncharacterized protein n=1 Tax=Dreissena polymorpha TaxID=45954 RepID=A0A9D4RID7_DREPO|nr:hypothetical protein DPMN_030531 [Dreissena polymorpha]